MHAAHPGETNLGPSRWDRNRSQPPTAHSPLPLTVPYRSRPPGQSDPVQVRSSKPSIRLLSALMEVPLS